MTSSVPLLSAPDSWLESALFVELVRLRERLHVKSRLPVQSAGKRTIAPPAARRVSYRESYGATLSPGEGKLTVTAVVKGLFAAAAPRFTVAGRPIAP